MSLPVLVLGRSGSGKTYSIKKFTEKDAGVISIEKGRLPFRSDLQVVKIPKALSNPDGSEVSSYSQLNAARYAWIENAIKMSKVKTIILDDTQYLMVNELFDRASEKGYDKYTEMAKHFQHLIHFINDLEDEEKIVYFLHHSETGTDGREKCKTIGKMLEEKLVIEGCFDIVLYCSDRKFFTQSNEICTAKTPEDLFATIEIDNDLKAVDDAIREYYRKEI